MLLQGLPLVFLLVNTRAPKRNDSSLGAHPAFSIISVLDKANVSGAIDSV